jgi:D-sorbitol dehydrogenase (acceptor)
MLRGSVWGTATGRKAARFAVDDRSSGVPLLGVLGCGVPVMRLNGKIALVTGAAHGIGRAIALRYAAEGAAVAIVDVDHDGADRLAQSIRRDGGRSLAIAADLERIEAIPPMIAACVAEFGRLDILVNNAGRSGPKPILDIAPEDWDRIFDLNVKSLFFCLQAAARQMIRQGGGGKIVNTASIAGKIGNVRHMHYGASKAAVISITHSAALQLAPHKIHVNALCPGIIDTRMWMETDRAITAARGEPAGSEFRRAVAAVPLGRAGTPEDVASVALFLASSDADYVTGQTINIDGGSRQD